MAFTLIQHPDLGHLAALLARQLRTRPPGLSPLEAEPLVVQTKGMEKWLALECARANGSYSRVEALTPVQFVMKLGFLALGQREDRTVFEKDVLPWALFRLLGRELAAQVPEVDELARYVNGSHEDKTLRLFSLARTLADLFDQYLLYRPQWLETWETGGRLDMPHRPEQVWQAHLWRRLQSEAGDTPTRADFFQRLKKRLEDPRSTANLPPRVVLFGMSLLPPRFLEVFALLGERIDVTLYLQLPSLMYWGDLESDRRARQAGRLGTGNRLLANLGRTGQEFMDLLLGFAPHTPDTWDEREFATVRPTLLGHLQDDLLWCRESQTEPVSLAADDPSLRIARCTGPLREVEVLHDLLLDALADVRAADRPGVPPAVHHRRPVGLAGKPHLAAGSRRSGGWHRGFFSRRAGAVVRGSLRAGWSGVGTDAA